MAKVGQRSILRAAVLAVIGTAVSFGVSLSPADVAPPVQPISITVEAIGNIQVPGQATVQIPKTSGQQAVVAQSSKTAGTLSTAGYFKVTIINKTQLPFQPGEYSVRFHFQSYSKSPGNPSAAIISGTTLYETDAASADAKFGSGDLFEEVSPLKPGAQQQYFFPFSASAISNGGVHATFLEVATCRIAESGLLIEAHGRNHYIPCSSPAYVNYYPASVEANPDCIFGARTPRGSFDQPIYRVDIDYVRHNDHYEANSDFEAMGINWFEGKDCTWWDSLNLVKGHGDHAHLLASISTSAVMNIAHTGPILDELKVTEADSQNPVSVTIPIFLHAPVEIVNQDWHKAWTGDLVKGDPTHQFPKGFYLPIFDDMYANLTDKPLHIELQVLWAEQPPVWRALQYNHRDPWFHENTEGEPLTDPSVDHSVLEALAGSPTRLPNEIIPFSGSFEFSATNSAKSESILLSIHGNKPLPPPVAAFPFVVPPHSKIFVRLDPVGTFRYPCYVSYIVDPTGQSGGYKNEIDEMVVTPAPLAKGKLNVTIKPVTTKSGKAMNLEKLTNGTIVRLEQ